MMKTQNKNRKHPTCSRCRFHGKKDIRVLQHQCPFRNCTCSSCFLIKRRSIIYRAQKNLDKTEDNSNDAESSGGSGDGSTISNGYNEMNMKSNCSVSRSSESSSDAINFGTTCVPSEGPVINSGAHSWKSETVSQQHSAIATTSTSAPVKNADHFKISDFQSLCLTFPELTPSQLQSIFEQCGHDFQRTIDRVLMTKWCNDIESKSSVHQFHNNNDWSSTTPDYASNGSSFPRSALPSSLGTGDGLNTNSYGHNANNENCYDWRSNSSTGAIDDLCNSDYGNDYYYDQSLASCAVMSTQGNNQALSANSPNWNYDYTNYWYNGSQGSNGSTSSNDITTGPHGLDGMHWHNGQSGQLAFGQTMHEHNL